MRLPDLNETKIGAAKGQEFPSAYSNNGFLVGSYSTVSGQLIAAEAIADVNLVASAHTLSFAVLT
jgi:hypothetical protein